MPDRREGNRSPSRVRPMEGRIRVVRRERHREVRSGGSRRWGPARWVVPKAGLRLLSRRASRERRTEDRARPPPAAAAASTTCRQRPATIPDPAKRRSPESLPSWAVPEVTRRLVWSSASGGAQSPAEQRRQRSEGTTPVRDLVLLLAAHLGKGVAVAVIGSKDGVVTEA
jgi:hypothetical protein